MVKAKIIWIPKTDGSFPKGPALLAQTTFNNWEDGFVVKVDFLGPPAKEITANVKILGEDPPILSPGDNFTLFDGEDPRAKVHVLEL